MKVVVLGAGVVGVAAAYYLAKAGHAVTVIERREAPALEASFANGGHLLGDTVVPWAAPDVPMMLAREFGREDAPYLLRLKLDLGIWLWSIGFLRNCTSARARDITKNLRRLAVLSFEATSEAGKSEGIAFDRDDRGILHLYRDPRTFARVARAAEKEQDARLRSDVLDMTACVEREPALGASKNLYAGGLHFQQERTGDAHKFAVGLAGAAEQLGATFRYGVTVRRILRSGSAITGVETDAGEIAADATVVSLGSHSPVLLRPLGLRLPIYPVKGYSITVPVDGHNGAPKMAVHDLARKIAVTRFGDRIRVAGTAELDGYDTRASEKRMTALMRHLITVFPDCGDIAGAERWTGLRPMTPDCAPIIGHTPVPGLYLDTGHGSLGWTLACGSGRVIADIVSGRAPEIDLTGLTMERF